MTKALTEQDGLSWRENLPPIPTVPLSVRERACQAASSVPNAQHNRTRAPEKPGKCPVLLFKNMPKKKKLPLVIVD